MSIEPRTRDDVTIAKAWLIQLLDWLIPIMLGMAILLLLWSVVAQSIAVGSIALSLLGYAGGLLWARQQARNGLLNHASSAASVGLLLVALFVGWHMPASLPTIPLLAVTAVGMAAPYLPAHRLRLLAGMAWCTIVLLIMLLNVFPSSRWLLAFTDLGPCVFTLLVLGLVLLLLYHFSLAAAGGMAPAAAARPTRARYHRPESLPMDSIRAEAALCYSEALLDAVYQMADIGIAITDEQGYFVRVNAAFCDLYGAASEEITGKCLTIIVPPDSAAQAVQTHAACIAGELTCSSREQRFRRADGSVLDVAVSSHRIQQADGQCFLVCTIANITEQKQLLAGLRSSEERFRNLFDHSPDAIFVQSLAGVILDVNRAACQLHGLEREELIGKHGADSKLTPPDQRDYITAHMQRVADGEVNFFEGISYGCDGRIIPVEVRAVRIMHLGAPALLLHVRDISEREEAAEQLYSLTNHDVLTRLPNRRLLRERLQQAMEREKKQPSALTAAVLFLDVDHFKSINNSLGHPIGDQLLVAVAQRLREFVRANDTVARVGGDEFAILIEQVQDEAAVNDVAMRLQEALTQPFFIGTHEISTTVSIGIALSSAKYAQPEEVLRDAGTAMHYAKEIGGMRSIFFDHTMYERAQQRLLVRTELPQAIENGELQLCYQPIVELVTGTIAGFEALVRWQHPRHGLLSPSAFIPIAEETGVIIALGRWIIREVCRQAREWTEQLDLTRTYTIYVNLSGREFRDPDLVKRVQSILGTEGLGAFKLKLEITEGVMMDDADSTIETLRQLCDLGVQLCIDDFGIGYSSLRYLQRFPVQTVKIDHSFVTHIDTDIESTSIVRAIMLVAHTLGMDVIAEWVETADQLVMLEAMGCEYGQGFLFSKPVDATTAGSLLKNAAYTTLQGEKKEDEQWGSSNVQSL